MNFTHSWKRLAPAFGWAGAYFALGWLGGFTAATSSQIPAVWPATAVAIAGVWRGGYPNGRVTPRYTGIAEKELIQSGTLPQIHADDRNSAKAAWQRSLAAHTPLDAEFRIRRKDGDL